jgi:hypothetical protein
MATALHVNVKSLLHVSLELARKVGLNQPFTCKVARAAPRIQTCGQAWQEAGSLREGGHLPQMVVSHFHGIMVTM